MATCSTALRFGHAFRGTLVLVHVHTSVCFIAVDGIIFAIFYAMRASLGMVAPVRGEVRDEVKAEEASKFMYKYSTVCTSSATQY